MKKQLLLLTMGLYTYCQSLAGYADVTEAQVTQAAQNALVYLMQQQNSDGSWGTSPRDRIKATAEAYSSLSLLSTLSTSAQAAKNWLKNTHPNDVDEKARIAYVLRFNGNLSQYFNAVLLKSGDVTANSLLENSTVKADADMALWGPFDDYKYSTIDTALSLRALLYANRKGNTALKAVILSSIDYLLETRNKEEQSSPLGGGWGFSSKDYSVSVNSKVLPTAYAILALTEHEIKWTRTSKGVIAAAHWLISKQKDNGQFGDDTLGSDAETVLATLALAHVIQRESADPLINQAYQQGKHYLVAQLETNGHISQSPLLTALALQTLPKAQIKLEDKDRDKVPDAIEARLGLDPKRFDPHKLIKGNGLTGKVLTIPQQIISLAAGYNAQVLVAPKGRMFEVTSGQLPDGLTLVDNATLLKGIPTTPGVYDVNFVVREKGHILFSAAIQFHIMAPEQDHDGDGIPSGFEIQYRLNPLNKADGGLDPDKDGWTNFEEFKNNTHPSKKNPKDTDGDGLTDEQEVALNTNPQKADSDDDRLDDGLEIKVGRDPLVNEPMLIIIMSYLLL